MSIKLRMAVLSCVTLAAALAAPAEAAPITYVESNGSLNYPPITSVGTLDVGVNSVSGSVNGGSGALNSDTEDEYSFILPSGYEITSATVTLVNFSFGAGSVHLSGTYTLSLLGVSQVYQQFVQNTTTSNLLASPETAAGVYDVTVVSPSSASDPSLGPQIFYSGSYGYTDTFTVALIPGGVTAVPEPGSIVLLLSAGLGLTLLQGRSRSNRVG